MLEYIQLATKGFRMSVRIVSGHQQIYGWQKSSKYFSLIVNGIVIADWQHSS
jgi:hypothetical protein